MRNFFSRELWGCELTVPWGSFTFVKSITKKKKKRKNEKNFSRPWNLTRFFNTYFCQIDFIYDSHGQTFSSHPVHRLCSDLHSHAFLVLLPTWVIPNLSAVNLSLCRGGKQRGGGRRGSDREPVPDRNSDVWLVRLREHASRKQMKFPSQRKRVLFRATRGRQGFAEAASRWQR